MTVEEAVEAEAALDIPAMVQAALDTVVAEEFSFPEVDAREDDEAPLVCNQ